MAYTVTAKRWEHGWELHIEGIGVTQSRLLGDAEAMVRDYLACDEVPDAATAEILIKPDLGGMEKLVEDVRAHLQRLMQEQIITASQSRDLVAKLRGQGYSVADTATILGVSKGRVSQLVNR